MDLPIYNFKGCYWREALAVENKIVYFGATCKNVTFVLEQEEGCGKLKVVKVDSGFDFLRRYYNTAACVFKNEIYSFKTGNYEEVYQYNLKSGKWNRFFSL